MKDARTARAMAATLGGNEQQQPHKDPSKMAASAQDQNKTITRELAEAAAAVASLNNTASGGKTLASALRRNAAPVAGAMGSDRPGGSREGSAMRRNGAAPPGAAAGSDPRV